MRLIKRSFMAGMLLLFCAVGVRAEKDDPLAFLKSGIQHRRLSNGINVLLVNRGYSPTLALMISFRVGSVDESYQTMGAAHLLEHMLFKGTDRIGTSDYASERVLLDQIERIGEALDRLKINDPNDSRIPALEKQIKKLEASEAKLVVESPYDRIYTSIGGVNFNASTSRDVTTYEIELPSGQLEVWAQIESERLRNPVMRQYYLERNTVLEERLMRYDSKGMEGLVELFIANAYTAHPYRHPVVGWASNIPFLSLRDVREFYNTQYIPSKMTITVVGRQNTEETIAVIEKYFGKIESRTEKTPVAVREPAQRGERRFNYKFKSNPYLLMGWHKPTYPSRDDYICDVIAGVLSDGKSSRLYRSLVLDRKIAAAVDAWNGFPAARYDNLFMIAAAPTNPHTPAECEAAVYEELHRLKNDITPAEIARVVNRSESSIVFDLDSNRGMAHAIGYYQAVFGDWKYMARYIDEIRSITPADVKTVIERYFTEDNRTVGVLLNIEEKKQAEGAEREKKR
jgi:predicted Zn-dependent peptidase